jgi:hypothetical protein
MAIVLGLALPMMMAAAHMWRVRTFTIDDAYISYRYARNLAHGVGLVYNPGERIEGYTNFLWTLILAGGIRVGVDPDLLAKLLGAASALGSIALAYGIAGRILPYTVVPATATWLLGSSIVATGWSVFGLETGFFVCLVLAGTYLFFVESEELAPPGAAAPPAWSRVPWSGLVFALAGLARPEAPMFVAVLMLSLGRGVIHRKNLLRAALFLAPVLAHVAFRHAYYGTWLPNTFAAKTGNLAAQLPAGAAYIGGWAAHVGELPYLAVLGVAFGALRRRRDVLVLVALALAVLGYVAIVGGDWMKFFRFMAPFEPLCFILVDVGVRRTLELADGPTNVAICALAAWIGVHRYAALRDAQIEILQKDKRFWDMATGGTARWLLINEPGKVALGDIGYVGWQTDYPILDLLGLVDPVISKLPGGYTQKLGPAFLDRFFDAAPKYFVLISATADCRVPSVIGSQLLWGDPRFQERYELGGTVPLDRGFAWCVYEQRIRHE